MAIGLYWGSQVPAILANNDPLITSGMAAVTATRFGAGGSWAVVYIAPSVFSIGLIVYLLETTRDRYDGW
jgi:hypothetical protein